MCDYAIISILHSLDVGSEAGTVGGGGDEAGSVGWSAEKDGNCVCSD